MQKYQDLVKNSVNLLVTSGDDFFDDEFNNEFDKMDKEDKFHNKLEDGFKNWEERYPSISCSIYSVQSLFSKKVVQR